MDDEPIWMMNCFVPGETKKWGVIFKGEVMRRLKLWDPWETTSSKYVAMMEPLTSPYIDESPEAHRRCAR